MNRVCLLLLFIGVSFSVSAQLSSLDSAAWYHDRSYNIWINSTPKHLFETYMQRGAALYHQNGVYVKEADCYRNLSGLYLIVKGNHQLAADFIHKAIATNAKAEIPSEELRYLCYRDMLTVKRYQHQNDSLVHYAELIIEQSEKIGPLTLENYPFGNPSDYTDWNNWLIDTKMVGQYWFSNYYLKIGEVKKAKQLLDQIANQEEWNDDNSWLIAGLYAEYYKVTGDYNKALTSLYENISTYQKHKPKAYYAISKSYQRIAKIYQYLGLAEQAIVCYERALESERKLNFRDSLQLNKIYNGIGELYRSTGEYEKALEYYRFAKDMAQQLRGEVSFAMGSICNNIGETYFALKNYQEALIWHKKALNIRLQVNDHPYRTNSYDNLGLTYLKLGDLTQAEHYITTCFQLRSKYPKTPQYEYYHIKSYLHLAELKQAQNKPQEALAFYQKALATNKSNLNNKDVAKYEILNKVGKLHLKQQQFDQAKASFHQGIQLNSPSFDQSKTLKGYYHGLSFLEALAGLAETAYQKSLQVPRQQQQTGLQESYQHYQLAMQLLVKIRQYFSSQKDKLSLGKYAKDIYHRAILVGHQLYQQTQNEKYKCALFQFSEQSKAGILLDAQNKRIAQQRGILPDSLIERETRYAALLSFYQQKLNAANPKEHKKWRAKFFNIQQKQAALSRKLEKRFPKYYQLKYETHVVKFAELQKQLKQGEVFLEFYEASDSLFAFIVSPTEFRLQTLQKLSSSTVQQFRNSVLDRDWNTYTTTASTIYKQLIAPLKLREAELLTIVPDGMLWHINFDLLLKEDPKQGDYRTLAYLLHDQATRYAYSAAHLLNSLQSLTGKSDVIAFAPSYEALNNNDVAMNSLEEKFRSQVSPLLHSTEEVNYINNQVKGQTFLGTQAVERVFKQQIAEKHAIVHLAMHALVDNSNPANSKLVFTYEEDTIEDNFLHIYELYNMQLPADLAVLSACNTGFGKLESGEGFMSLGRAFAYAGCPSVVMSHWKVDDLATSQLMECFYKKLAKGMDKAAALRAAKLDYLSRAKPNTAYPFLWGSFVLLGDNTPIEFEQSITVNKWYVSAVLFVFIGLGILFYRRNLNS